MTKLVLYGRPGWGSAIVEAQLTWCGVDYDYREVGDLLAEEAAREPLLGVNPLAQVPTLVLEDGSILTESAAITLWLAEYTRCNDLAPLADEPCRAQFLRWLVFIVANIYPTYTYADIPTRFVSSKEAADGFANNVNAYAQKLYRVLEDAAADGEHFLPGRASALDVYAAVLTQWRPGPAWFKANTPKLCSIAARLHHDEKLRPMWLRNFPKLAA